MNHRSEKYKLPLKIKHSSSKLSILSKIQRSASKCKIIQSKSTVDIESDESEKSDKFFNSIVIQRLQRLYKLKDSSFWDNKLNFDIIMNTPSSDETIGEFNFDYGYGVFQQYFSEMQEVYHYLYERQISEKPEKQTNSKFNLRINFNNKALSHFPRGQGILEIKKLSGRTLTIHIILEGKFSDQGFLNGKAIFRNLLNGDIYQGDMVDSMANGMGKFSSIQKLYTYEGAWKNNQPFGYGEIKVMPPSSNKFQESKCIRYVGQVVNGKKHGKGTLFLQKNVFEGSFENDDIEGNCTMYCENGDKYEGEWRKSEKDGYGRYIWKNGNIYEGAYWKGQKHGYGSLYQQKTDKQNISQSNRTTPTNRCLKQQVNIKINEKFERIYEGMWKNGKRDGKGSLTIKNKKVTGIWYEGRLKEQI